jgi:hypothetical protein
MGAHPNGVMLLLAMLATALPARLPAQQVTPIQVNQIEQDVRDLRRQVEAQQRRIEVLERSAGGATSRGPSGPRGTAAAPPVPAPATAAPWLSAANWAAIRPALAELEVIARLGPPTSMRVADDGRRRTLFYALEIGASGYLAGNVVLEDGRVVSVEAPRLR